MDRYYKLCIKQYDIFVNDCVVYIRYLQTNDLYHFIGYLYCNSLEHIKRVDYCEITQKEFENGQNKVYLKGKEYFYSNIKESR